MVYDHVYQDENDDIYEDLCSLRNLAQGQVQRDAGCDWLIKPLELVMSYPVCSLPFCMLHV